MMTRDNESTIKTGARALTDAGFPHEFIASAMVKANELGIALAIRVGQPPNTSEGFSVAFKPMEVKTKTSSNAQGIPLVAGFIPIDQQTFGRSHSKDLPKSDSIKPVQLKVTLQKMLEDHKSGKYTMVHNNGILEFKATKKDETQYDPREDKNKVNKKDIVFRIDLNQGSEKLTLTEQEQRLINPWAKPAAISKPDWWPQNAVEFESALNKIYPVSYQLPGGNQSPLMVAGSADGKPITGDADLLWIGRSPNLVKASENCLHFNSSKTEQLTELVKSSIEIKNKFNSEKVDVEKINDLVDQASRFAKTSGIISPHELMVVDTINAEFAKSVPYINNLFQHGPETNNPGEPSSLDAPMLHLFDGKIVLTQNEQQLRDFVLETDKYLDHY